MMPLLDGKILVENSITDGQEQVTVIHDTGAMIGTLTTTEKDITAFIPMTKSQCLILHKDGSIVRMSLEDGEELEWYEVPGIKRLEDGIKLDDEEILLVDFKKGKVFMYNLIDKEKQFVFRKLNKPMSIDIAETDDGTLIFIVVETGAHRVNVYDDNGKQIARIGGRGAADGKLDHPVSARFLPDSTIIVSDYMNKRISRFNLQGEFIEHLLTASDGIMYPGRLAVQYPNVWVAYEDEIHAQHDNTEEDDDDSDDADDDDSDDEDEEEEEDDDDDDDDDVDEIVNIKCFQIYK